MKPVSRPALWGVTLFLAALPLAAPAQTGSKAGQAADAYGNPLLTPQQKQQGKVRLQAFAQAMEALRNNKTMTLQQKQAKAAVLQAQLDKDEMALLTPAQRAAVLRQRATMKQRSQAFVKTHQADLAQRNQLNEQLNKSLTPDQKKQLLALNQSVQTQFQQLQADTTLSPQAKQQKALQIQQQSRDKMVALFTPAQRATYQKLTQLQQKLNADATALQRQPIK